jgi:TolB-like protein/tetratricopeptide (TPR) repeat protein
MDQDEINFGRIQFDLRRRELKRDGTLVQLGSRARDILWVLASANGRVVSKDELMKLVWHDRVVEENNIQVHISALRKALDEGQNGQSCVITVPGRGYRLVGAKGAPSTSLRHVEAWPGPIPDKPSIAALPFESMSGDPEQQYFADGVVDEIITALSRFSGLFVIARNSTFTYKGRAVDVKQVGRELGVRYVLEGSVRRGGDRLRITGQLIDASTGMHLWADRFDGNAKDIFELQDRVTASVVGAIMPRLEQAEIERAKRKPTENLDAYDYYLRGTEYLYQNTRESIDRAMPLFARAIELDPAFASAYAAGAVCYHRRLISGWMADREKEVREAARLARAAVAFGKDDAAVLARAGHVLAVVAHELDAGQLFIDRALALNPNWANAWHSSGWQMVYTGDPNTAIEHFAQFMRLSPLDPMIPHVRSGSAFAHFFAGRYDEACSIAEQVLQERPNLHQGLRIFIASHVFAGYVERAQQALSRLRHIDPGLRVSNLGDMTPLRRPEDITRYHDAMRKAGLPE